MFSKFTRLSQPAAVLPTIILIVSIFSLQLFHYQHAKHAVDYLEYPYKWDESIVKQQLFFLKKIPKFGYRNIFADWTFLSFLQYFGDFKLRKTTGYSLSSDYFESIVDTDPYFVESYVFLINSISMYAGQPQQSINLMEKGLARMGPNSPDRSYFIWRHKGTDELLFIGDIESAQESYQTAAIWAEQSFDKDSSLVAQLSRKTADFLATNPQSNSAQIGAWSEVLLRATDDNIRKEAVANIESLGGLVLFAENGQVTVRYKTDNK